MEGNYRERSAARRALGLCAHHGNHKPCLQCEKDNKRDYKRGKKPLTDADRAYKRRYYKRRYKAIKKIKGFCIQCGRTSVRFVRCLRCRKMQRKYRMKK